jgi:hypothetical protein
LSISAKDFSTVNAVGSGVLLAPIQTQQPQQPQPQPQDESKEHDSDESDSDESETGIPSDLSIDHHPRCTNDYTLSFQKGSTQLEEEDVLVEKDATTNDTKWMLNNHCISDLCLKLKNTTMQIIKQTNSAQLSDARLLVLNDIYLFDKNHAMTVSKYFTLEIHNTIKSSLFFEAYFPPRGIQC